MELTKDFIIHYIILVSYEVSAPFTIERGTKKGRITGVQSCGLSDISDVNGCECIDGETIYEMDYGQYCSKLSDITNWNRCKGYIDLNSDFKTDFTECLSNGTKNVMIEFRNKELNKQSFWDRRFSADIVAHTIQIVNGGRTIVLNLKDEIRGLLLRVDYRCKDQITCYIVRIQGRQNYPFQWTGPTTPNIKTTSTTISTTPPTTTTTTTSTTTTSSTTPTNSIETETTVFDTTTTITHTISPTRNSQSNSGESNDIPLIIGVAVAGIVITIILVAGIFIWFSKHQLKRIDKKKPGNTDRIGRSTNQDLTYHAYAYPQFQAHENKTATQSNPTIKNTNDSNGNIGLQNIDYETPVPDLNVTNQGYYQSLGDSTYQNEIYQDIITPPKADYEVIEYT